jgi:hypothetical protein
MTFYAYIHCRPDLTPFYVGKGSGVRWKTISKTWRNKYHWAISTKYGIKNILKWKMDCSSEQIAFDLEKGLIRCLSDQGYKLANFTSGGEGGSGHSPSNETRQKLRKALTGRPQSLEHKANVRLSLLGRKRTPEQKERISKACVGRKASLETKIKMSLSLKQKPKSPAHAAAIKHAVRSQPVVTCPTCSKTGKLRAMRRWHFVNCKLNSSNRSS